MATETRRRRVHLPKGTLRKKGIITVPEAIREELDLHEGDEFVFAVEDRHIVLMPAITLPEEQTWFWTREWQDREKEADNDLASGRYTRFDSAESFLSSLDS